MSYTLSALRPLVITILCALALAGQSALMTAQDAVGRIAFASNRDGDFEIWVTRPDGADARALTTNSAEDIEPVWSPDGRSLAFVSARDGNQEIYVVNADGTGERRLTADPGVDVSPAWSPDGRSLAFVSNRAGNADVYIVSARGGAVRRLTNDRADDWQPSWSPDGTRVLFISGRQAVNSDGAGEMYVVPVAGGTAAPLIKASRKVHVARWAPDGKTVAFFATGNRRHEISVVNPDGTGERNLSSGAAGDSQPRWAPDGRAIAFLGDRDQGGALGIFVMADDGSAPRRVSASDQRVFHDFAWSSDGRRIVYSGFMRSNWHLFVADITTGERRQLTTTPSMDIGAAWSPK